MGRNKLERYDEIAEFGNVQEKDDFQDEDSEKPKGKWQPEIFGNDNPIVLELACGKGTYTLELARRNPDKNFVGIDIKGARIWKGAKKAKAEGLENIQFLRIYIDHLDEYFAPGEVNDIWITFPDPYLKDSNKSKRLTSPKFLNIYRKVLTADAKIRLKTDSDKLFSYTKEVLENENCKIVDIVENVYKERPDDELLTIKTDFEKRHLERERTIKYIEFTL